MRRPSRSFVMTVAASALAACITSAIGFAVSVAPMGEAFAAKKGGKKPPSKQETKKSEPYPINDDVDDPAVWGKVFPLQYELYLKTVDMQRTKYGGSEAVPHTPSRPTRAAWSRIEGRGGRRTQGDVAGLCFRGRFPRRPRPRLHAGRPDLHQAPGGRRAARRLHELPCLHLCRVQEGGRRRHHQRLREDQPDALSRTRSSW